MSEENPYAPPMVAEPRAEPVLAWQVDGDSVLVKNGATLPQVDLLTGATGEELVAAKRLHEHRGWQVFLIAGVVAVSFFINRVTSYEVPTVVILVGAGVMSFVAQRLGLIQVVTFHEFRERPRERRRKRRSVVRIGSALLAPLLIAGSIAFGSTDAILAALVASGVILLLVLVVAAIDRPQPRCRSGDAGWIRVGPAHSRALDFLRAAEREAREAAQLGGRKWKVRTGYLNRWPYSMLIDRQTKFHEALNVILAKTFRLRQMEYTFLEPGQEQDCPLEDCHAALREAAASWAADHPDWPRLAVQCQDAPFVPVRSELAIFADPPGRVLLELACFRATAKPDEARCHVTVRSWLASGTRIMTSARRRSPLLPPDVDFEHVDAGAWQLVARHLERITRVEPLVLTPREMNERTRVEAMDEMAEMETRGWVSGVREVG